MSKYMAKLDVSRRSMPSGPKVSSKQGTVSQPNFPNKAIGGLFNAGVFKVECHWI